jgi:hypothetical protein
VLGMLKRVNTLLEVPELKQALMSLNDLVRAAQQLLKNADGQARTEDLRQAMVHYRALFEDLLGPGDETAQRDAERDEVREVK